MLFENRVVEHAGVCAGCAGRVLVDEFVDHSTVSSVETHLRFGAAAKHSGGQGHPLLDGRVRPLQREAHNLVGRLAADLVVWENVERLSTRLRESAVACPPCALCPEAVFGATQEHTQQGLAHAVQGDGA